METMTRIKPTLYQLYRRAKLWLNYCLDRIIDLCDLVLMDAYQLPWSTGQSVAKHIARYVGDISWLLRAFPRLPVYKLIGTDWTIIFVGTEPNLREIRALFFEEARQQEMGRIALWKLSAQSQQWLAEGVDLVVCELSRIYPWPPKAALTFTVPSWIQQSIAIPGSLESLISGKEGRNIRHKLYRAEKFGFNYRFSQAKADFDHFYYHMYVPFIKARHDHLALIAPYHDQWQRWFVRGGLVMTTQNDSPVAGSLCYMADDICYIIEMGVLEAAPRLLKSEINTIVVWHAITWGREQGAKQFDLGGSRAWCSNGAFTSKRRWRAKVVRRKRIYRTWTFLTQNPSLSLREYVNELGFISEINGKFYEVLLSFDSASTGERDVNKELSAINSLGLDGLVIISPNSNPIVYNVAA
jgi:hypothetical protein